jgi:hypothetical protein
MRLVAPPGMGGSFPGRWAVETQAPDTGLNHDSSVSWDVLN